MRCREGRSDICADVLTVPSLGVPVGPRPSGQATNGRALPDPLECEFDFVNGVINILFHQHSINIAGQK